MYRGLLVFGAGCLAAEHELCPTTPEILVLQDSSASLKEVHLTMSKDIGNLLTDWAASYGTPVKMGFASFTDKPTPLMGWGGRYATGWENWDTCWDFGVEVTDDHELVQREFDSMAMRDGGDFAEAQYEALLYASKDPRVGFTSSSIRRDEENRLITRLVLMITDDVSHLPGQGQAGIDKYNSPLQDDGYGGWGDVNFVGYQGSVWQNASYPYSGEGYLQMATLIRYEEYGLSAEEAEELAYLREVYGPPRWESMLEPHDGEYDESSCYTKDYPTLGQLKAGLDAAAIIPIVMVTAPGKKMIDLEAQRACSEEFGYEIVGNEFVDPSVIVDCLVWHYTTAFENVGINAVVSSFDSADDVVDAVRTAVLAASDYACNLAVDTTEEPEPTPEETEPTPEPTPEETEPTPEPTPEETEPTPEPTPEETEPTPEPTPEETEPTPEETEPTPEETEPTAEPTPEETEPTAEPTPEETEPTPEPTPEETEPTPEPTPEETEPTPEPTPEETEPTPEPTPEETETEPTPEPTPEETEPTPEPTPEETEPTPEPTRPATTPADADDDEDDSGANVPVIAGATGGAVAGVAGLAALLYKQFGAGLFGNNSTPDLTSAEQVDAPDNQMEREGVEEVTMDMFQ